MRRLMFLVVGGLCMMVIACDSDDGEADLVVTGTIRTMDPAVPVADAVAVADGRILFVGNASGDQGVPAP
jgi:hypothetical protein